MSDIEVRFQGVGGRRKTRVVRDRAGCMRRRVDNKKKIPIFLLYPAIMIRLAASLGSCPERVPFANVERIP